MNEDKFFGFSDCVGSQVIAMLLRLCNWLYIDCRLVKLLVFFLLFLLLCYLLHLLRIKLLNMQNLIFKLYY